MDRTFLLSQVCAKNHSVVTAGGHWCCCIRWDRILQTTGYSDKQHLFEVTGTSCIIMSHITWRSHLVYIDVLCSYVKGTVPRYFPPPAFFIKRLLLVPIDKPRNVFNFLNIHRVIWLFRCFTSVNDTGKVNGIIVVGWPLYYLYPEYLMHTF